MNTNNLHNLLNIVKKTIIFLSENNTKNTLYKEGVINGDNNRNILLSAIGEARID